MKFRVILFLLIAIFLATFSYFLYSARPFSNDKSVKVFEVVKGQGIKSISQHLVESNLIRNQYSFIIYSYTMGLNKKFKVGNYKLSASMSTKEIATQLSKEGINDYWLKIIDGSRVEQITALPLVQTKNLEGYLYPDSYLIPKYFTVDQILEVIKKNFDKKFAQAKENQTNKMTDNQIVILASILEREGKSLESKQIIAGILLNRMEIGMPLQLCASVQYARDSKNSPKEYWTPLISTQIDTTISPFNTYQNKGLPPKPISNPGYNSLYAAFHPTDSDYLFYITGNDGKFYYAKTITEHNKNIANYLK
ncbi:MAG: endolytic transglycosylase MltG [Candidatus Shapirobacteria bacterium]